MKERGVTRVLSVLSGAELEYYQIALGDSYGKYFSGHELVSDLKAEGARDKALALLKAAKEAGEKVVVHCAGGQGRTGTVLGTWMVTEYGLSPEEAAKEIEEHMKVVNSSRWPKPEKIADFVTNGHL
mmetsp:Transcript_64561/g.203780  ORF Transcript_64561/g.203780 Transcript_64561/m.203780 type:complete len:127 (+) Transcript_64561:242-622(+)